MWLWRYVDSCPPKNVHAEVPLWKSQFCGMWRRVIWYRGTSISKENASSSSGQKRKFTRLHSYIFQNSNLRSDHCENFECHKCYFFSRNNYQGRLVNTACRAAALPEFLTTITISIWIKIMVTTHDKNFYSDINLVFFFKSSGTTAALMVGPPPLTTIKRCHVCDGTPKR
jgi:hypothetical protein